jgi:hypothetical protein
VVVGTSSSFSSMLEAAELQNIISLKAINFIKAIPFNKYLKLYFRKSVVLVIIITQHNPQTPYAPKPPTNKKEKGKG